MRTNPYPFTFTTHSGLRFCVGVFVALSWMAFSTTPARAQTTNYVLGTTALLEGPAAGIDSVVLAVTPQTASWTATANAAWLHLNVANQNGTGSTNVIFTFDANLDGTRSGTLSIGDQILTVTQAGSTYVPVVALTTLVSSGLNEPIGVAVDGAGNVYIADTVNQAIKKWTAASNNVTTLVSLAMQQEYVVGVASDGTGNIYTAGYRSFINNPGDIFMWTAATSNLTSLVSGLNEPQGVAIDSAGDVYIEETGRHAIKKWSMGNSNVTTLVSSGLDVPIGIALDVAGNVYISDSGNNAVKEWTAANSNVTTLVPTLKDPEGVAVDGAGNVYIGGNQDNAVTKWTAANSNVTKLVPTGLINPTGVAVDGARNLYIVDTGHAAVKELPYAFVDRTARSEGVTAGSDALPAVLPTTENLLPPFAPTSDKPWLTIIRITNGVVSFSFTSNNSSASRTAHVTLLGQTIPITQSGIVPPTITDAAMLADGAFQFVFSNNQGVSFSVVSSTNLLSPLTNWTAVGTPSNIGPGFFQFTTLPATNDPQRFYRVRSP